MTKSVRYHKGCKGGMPMITGKHRRELEQLKKENEQLKTFLLQKQEEERAEVLRQQQMHNFWAYDGSPQEGWDA